MSATATESRFLQFLRDYQGAGHKADGRYYGLSAECGIGVAVQRLGRLRVLPVSLERLGEIVEEEVKAYCAEQAARDAEARSFEALRARIDAATPRECGEPERCRKVVVSRTPVTPALGRAMALDAGFDLAAAGVKEIIIEEDDPSDRARYEREYAEYSRAMAERSARVYAVAVAEFGRRPKSGSDMRDYDLAGRIVARATA